MNARLLLVFLMMSMPVYAIDMKKALEKEEVKKEKIIKTQPTNKKTSGVKTKKSQTKKHSTLPSDVKYKANTNLIISKEREKTEPLSEHEHIAQKKDSEVNHTSNKESNEPTAKGNEKPKNCIKMLGGCFFGD